MEKEDIIKTGVAWRGLQTECPNCGEVFDIEEDSLEQPTICYNCDCEFQPKE